MTTAITPQKWLPSATVHALVELQNHVAHELRAAEFEEEELDFAFETFDDEGGEKEPPCGWDAKRVYSIWLQRWLFQLLTAIDQETDARCPDAKLPG